MTATIVAKHIPIRRTGGHTIIPKAGTAVTRAGITSMAPTGIAVESPPVTHIGKALHENARPLLNPREV
jgi:hypothetical protein